jgi:Tfp pilus assembly pilus retraction ATPase PilT
MKSARVEGSYGRSGIQDLHQSLSSSHILNIENPVEFMHESRKSLIRHREVGLNTLKFHHALRAALREDPDVILVGVIALGLIRTNDNERAAYHDILVNKDACRDYTQQGSLEGGGGDHVAKQFRWHGHIE